MLLRFIIIAAAVAVASGSLFSKSAHAEDLLEARSPVVVEMFVSQACQNCPMAAEHFVELAERQDIVALSWHVDYWDSAFAGRNGRWADPFADPVFSARQRKYNSNLRGRPTVFTPQVVVNGSTSVIGSHFSEIDDAIKDNHTARIAPSIRFQEAEDRKLEVAFDNLGTDQNVFLVSFYKQAETKIKGGANAGIVFKNAHIVDEVQSLNLLSASNRSVVIDTPVDHMGCAVVVQAPDQGDIISAAYCPEQ